MVFVLGDHLHLCCCIKILFCFRRRYIGLANSQGPSDTMDLLLTDPSGSEDEEYFSTSSLPYRYVEESCPSEDAVLDGEQMCLKSEEALLKAAAPDDEQSSSRAEENDDDELRQLRRVQIEKLALTISPPISHRLLAHMTSFREAIQVAAPLNVAEWDSLLPSMVAERTEAGTKLKAATKLKVRGQALDILIKKKLKDYLFDYWHLDWGHVSVVPQKDRGRFATEALSHIRTAFFNEFESKTANNNPSGGFLDPLAKPFLTLRYLVWIFEQMMSQHLGGWSTLFLCPKCLIRTKKLNLNGLLSHYSSKHSLKFHSGNKAIDMAAEWPRDFVFCHRAPICPDISEVHEHTLKAASRLETVSLDAEDENKSAVSQNKPLMKTICSTAIDVWYNLPDTTTNFVKARILIDQLVRKYNENSQVITLELFRDILQADCMEEIRSCNVIRCTSCHISSKKLKRKPLSAIVEHFYDEHYGQQSLLKGQSDWRKDMIFVPLNRLLEAWTRESGKMSSVVRSMYLQAFPSLPTGRSVTPKPMTAIPELKAAELIDPVFEALDNFFPASPALDTSASDPVQQTCTPSAADQLSLSPASKTDKVEAAISKSDSTLVETTAVLPMKRALESPGRSQVSDRRGEKKKWKAPKVAQKRQIGSSNGADTATDWEEHPNLTEGKKRPLEDAEENSLSSKGVKQDLLPRSEFHSEI